MTCLMLKALLYGREQAENLIENLVRKRSSIIERGE